MTLYMETTRIPAQKTAQQVSHLLGSSGARQVLLEYADDREIAGIHFLLRVGERDVAFQLPVRIEPLYARLNGRRKYQRQSHEDQDRDQARRVAWRQVLRWLEAQLALVDTGMVEAAEVFLPYLQTGPQRTLYQDLRARGLALPAPETKG